MEMYTRRQPHHAHHATLSALTALLFACVRVCVCACVRGGRWEQHVAMHLSPYCSPPSAAWLPRNTALSLKEHQEREATIAIKQAAQAERTSRLIEHVASSLDAVRARQDEMDARLSRLVELSSARQQAGA
jgi:hypothetical protein